MELYLDQLEQLGSAIRGMKMAAGSVSELLVDNRYRGTIAEIARDSGDYLENRVEQKTSQLIETITEFIGWLDDAEQETRETFESVMCNSDDCLVGV